MKQKRSKSIRLMTMGASALALTACGEADKEVGVFKSVTECVNTGSYTRAQCVEAARKAAEQHPKVAPKYTSIADCEADFGAGKCQSSPYRTNAGGGVWMPLFVGYMIGRGLGRGSGFGAQPLYRSKDDPGRYRTANNRAIPGRTGVVKVPASAATRPTAKLHTTRRGGFGASGRSYSSRRSSSSRRGSYGG